jgi:hypothetical protein
MNGGNADGGRDKLKLQTLKIFLCGRVFHLRCVFLTRFQSSSSAKRKISLSLLFLPLTIDIYLCASSCPARYQT